jgi:hypothetical protein
MKKIFIMRIFLFLAVVGYSQNVKRILEDAAQNYPLLDAKHFETEVKTDQIKYARSAALPCIDCISKCAILCCPLLSRVTNLEGLS